jgi:hypothetical protein
MKIGMRSLRFFILLFAASSLLFHPPSDFEAFAATSDGSVDSTVEINDSTDEGPELLDNEYFGSSIANIGDLDGDGVDDLAVGASHVDTPNPGGLNEGGAVFIMFMDITGYPKSTVEINEDTDDGPDLRKRDHFGRSVANIGDLNGDGINDLAVGAFSDDAGYSNAGAVHICSWILLATQNPLLRLMIPRMTALC